VSKVEKDKTVVIITTNLKFEEEIEIDNMPKGDEQRLTWLEVSPS
jgi:hypothetical protein